MSRKSRKKLREGKPLLPPEVKQGIWAVALLLLAVLIGLSFIGLAGQAGDVFIRNFHFLIGEAIFITPLVLILAGLVFFKAIKNSGGRKEVFDPTILAIIIMIIGIAGFLGLFDVDKKQGGVVGYFITWPFLKYFGFWASVFIFSAPIAIGVFIFWHFLRAYADVEADGKEKKIVSVPEAKGEEKTSIIKKIFAPRFKTEDLFPLSEEKQDKPTVMAKMEAKPSGPKFPYNPPPIDLLEREHGSPTSGDIKVNSAIIKRTLQNFGIDVSMSEVNIGPTVTQYTLKPAEGVKLSKITTLNNDLSLALASHPIRIEAPVPGRALVGVEIPNKVRAQVRLRGLIETPEFQKSTSDLLIPLGKDVAGMPIYIDLARMPHMLVAGSTGTGKTIFLNSLIMSLLYQSSAPNKSASPTHLRLIMVDPKRVEFPVYSQLPHLLCPVIYNATQTVNALKWLTGEMERRFDVLAEARVRNIAGYNEKIVKAGEDPMPYIVLIIDELADLMMTRGKDIEAGIVRLAQMARAVGIHLVVATQRPSVEVITGLIKANITCRITFQVASQVDSRTVLDSSGAEKLLGAGDMLYVSAQVPKPKRIQGAYISEKEVKRVVAHIDAQKEKLDTEMNDNLVEELDKSNEEGGRETFYGNSDNGNEDPLYEEAKKVVIEANKASASLLQRRLRLGYARAARLIDMLEARGVVGHGEGAKPREIYGEGKSSDSEITELSRLDSPTFASNKEKEKDEEDENWEKI